MVVVTVAICWWTSWTACWVVSTNFRTPIHCIVVGSGVVLHLVHRSFNLLGYDQVLYFSWHCFMPWIRRVHIHLKEKRVINDSSQVVQKCPPWKRSEAYYSLLWLHPPRQLWQWRQTDSTFHPQTVQLLSGSTYSQVSELSRALCICFIVLRVWFWSHISCVVSLSLLW